MAVTALPPAGVTFAPVPLSRECWIGGVVEISRGSEPVLRRLLAASGGGSLISVPVGMLLLFVYDEARALWAFRDDALPTLPLRFDAVLLLLLWPNSELSIHEDDVDRTDGADSLWLLVGWLVLLLLAAGMAIFADLTGYIGYACMVHIRLYPSGTIPTDLAPELLLYVLKGFCGKCIPPWLSVAPM